MLKILKYEMRKVLATRIVMLLTLAVMEVVYLVSATVGDKHFSDRPIAVAMGVIIFACFFIFIAIIAFESALGFTKELRTKKSYMYFMTDKSTYSIIGAKIINTIIWVVIIGLIVFGLCCLNVSILMDRSATAWEIMSIIDGLLDAFRLFPIFSDGNIFRFTVTILMNAAFIFVLAYFAISISSTVLSNSKANGFVSFIIFIVLTITYFKVVNIVVNNQYFLTNSFIVRNALIVIIVGAILFIISGRLFQKRINL